MAPEILLPETVEQAGPQSDVWSLGATLFFLVHGTPPWEASSYEELNRKVRNDELTFPKNIHNRIDPHLRHLIQRMLEKDPLKRPSIDWVKQHDWITNEGIEPMPEYLDHAELHQSSEEEDNSINNKGVEEDDDGAIIEVVNVVGDDDLEFATQIVSDSDYSSTSSSSDEDEDGDDAEAVAPLFTSSKEQMKQKTSLSSTTGKGGKKRRKSFTGNTTIAKTTKEERLQYMTNVIQTVHNDSICFGSHLEQGMPSYQEDRVYIDTPITKGAGGTTHAFGIFDGHGGHGTSELLLDVVPKQLREVESCSTFINNKNNEFNNIFLDIDQLILLQLEKGT